MTVATTLNKVTYNGNAGTVTFPFTFAIPGGLTASQVAALLTVTYVDPTGVSTEIAYGTASSQYQLVVNSPISPNPTAVGGTVTFNNSGTPIPLGSSLTIERTLPETQGTSLQNQGTLWQTVIEQALDYLTMSVQQLQALFGNFVQAPQTDPTGLNYTLPSASARANQALVFDNDGNVTTGEVPTGGIISAPMAPVVSAASLALARTAFGIGTIATENIGGGLQDDGAGNLRVIFAVSTVAVSRAVTTADYLNKLKVTGPITLTLPRANTLWSGFGFWYENLSPGGLLTIAIDSHDSIENGASGVSLIVPVGWSGFIVTDGAASGKWYMENSQGQTVNNTPAGVFTDLSIKVLTGAVGNNTISASATSVSVTDGTFFYIAAPSGTLNLNTTGLLGLDTGALAANQEYHIWAIYNPVTRASSWLASLQSTANATFLSNLPTGYTAYARAGTVKTAAAIALHGTWQRGKQVKYLVGTGQTSTLRAINANANVGSVTVPTYVAQTVASVTGVVSTLAVSIFVMGTVVNSTTGILLVAPNGSYGSSTSTSNPPPMQVGGSTSGSNQQNSVEEMLLETTQIFYASSAAAQGGIYCTGWTEPVNA